MVVHQLSGFAARLNTHMRLIRCGERIAPASRLGVGKTHAAIFPGGLAIFAHIG
jgi:hypothetical protein